MWNRVHQSSVWAVEMGYMGGACGVIRWDDESKEGMYERCVLMEISNNDSNEGVYKRCIMGAFATGEKCGVVQFVRRNTVRWSGYIKKMKSKEFMEKVYLSESECPNRRGSPPGRWKGRVKDFMNEEDAGRGKERVSG